MINDVVNLFCIELMQYGYGNSTISESGQEGDSPMCGVTSANGNFIAFLNAAVLKNNVQLLYFSCYVVKLECCSLIVCQSIRIPIVDYRIVN